MKKSVILGSIFVLLSTVAVHVHADEGKSPAAPQTSLREDSAQSAGAAIFATSCVMCHPYGGNRFYPNLPLIGAPQLKDFDAFVTFIRHPTLPDGSMGPMPPISEVQLSDAQAKDLYGFINTELKRSSEPGIGPQEPQPGYGPYGPGPGYGMGPGMMGRGYGMGPGMMGPGYGYGMGPGMMGPGYGSQPGSPGYEGPNYGQPSKPLDEKEARRLVQDYLKNTRNPNLKIGKLVDKGTYFVAQILTQEGSLVDKIIVNKKTGLMHSAY